MLSQQQESAQQYGQLTALPHELASP